MKITQCKGNGHGMCKRCADNGKWNMQWMCFLYRIEGREGYYCKECCNEIEKEERRVATMLYEDVYER